LANVSMCDRCRKFGLRKGLGAVALQTDLSDKTTQETKELCPTCIAGLIEWLEAPGKEIDAGGGMAGGFTQPYQRPEDTPTAAPALPSSPSTAEGW